MNSASLKGNVVPPNPEKLRAMQHIVQDAVSDATEAGGIFWSEDAGFELKIPAPAADQTMPMPLYILGLCFMRLSTDPNFASELMTWAHRNQN